MLYEPSTERNAAGLNLLAGKACGVNGAEAAAVEVWLGVPTPARGRRHRRRLLRSGGQRAAGTWCARQVPKEEIVIREVPVDREVIREVEREVVKTEILEVAPPLPLPLPRPYPTLTLPVPYP